MTEVKRPISLDLNFGLGSTSSGFSSTPKSEPPTPSTAASSNKNHNNTNSIPSSGSPDSPSLILPYLYVGDQDQTQIETISNLNISYILSLQSLPKFLNSTAAAFDVAEKNDQVDPDALLPSLNSSKDYLVKFKSCVHKFIRGKCINVSDTFEQLVEKFFDETHCFIEEARRNKCNILVHCKAGVSRSPTIAIAYLMKWKKLHLQDAYDLVKRCRPQISPNLNFMGQLISYEKKLRHQCFHHPIGRHLPSPSVVSCHRELTTSHGGDES